MPTYEFRCPKGHEFEKFYRSISGAPSEVVCPTCGEKSERLMSAGGGLVFKGSGFYITDYGKDGKKAQTPPAAKVGEGASASSSGGDSPSGGVSESSSVKSEAKPGAEKKPSGDTNSSGDSKSATAPKPAAASKSAAKGSSRRAKSSE